MSDLELSAAATSLPYREGMSLRLQVLRSFGDWPFSGQSILSKTLIAGIYSVTRSSVLNFVLFGNAESGSRPPLQAVLKLYDRRFGTRLRDYRYRHVPHTAEREAAYHSFVRQGKMGAFLRELDEKEKETNLIMPAWHFLDDCGPENSENSAKYEAIMWRECESNFNRETEAYERLKDVQGTTIPRMYAHVRLVLQDPDMPQDLLGSPDTARYFEVKGVLLQFIPGHTLSQLHTSPLALLEPEKWQAIIQAAVDAVHEIDKRGVLNMSVAPHNVVVNSRTQTPYIVDFGNCDFKDRMIKLWKESGRMDDDDDEEIEYWERVVTQNNGQAIGGAMAARLQRAHGVKLDIKYPDCAMILKDLKRSRGVESDEDSDSGWKIMHF
ncbi:uncharacterized protein B0T15DRAFT_568372 [Chaetomium strumarium]|uniref:Protein kinase domain-containing protein n=1 Tax=Chaetomium strumarium TaxID=1170767 RepID=A0AAJ0GR76_9PEZI|nr:hypothetical protein B0T15DRAFT_568372 [Chaetomium strumarium]